jgi:hypothetical protein
MTRDIAASVRGRLANIAKESGRPLQELMQYFVMERFLYRLSRSDHADRFVLKGALMFTVWGTSQSRATRDIDLLARSDNSVESMTKLMREVCNVPVIPDGVEFDSTSIAGSKIKEDAEYSGVRISFYARIQNARLPIQIDIGIGDVIYPNASLVEYPGLLDFDRPKLKGYPKETVIAEKFEAMIKLGQLNSRMKDFFDIFTLCKQFDFDGVILAEAIRKTFQNRGTAIDPSPFAFSDEFASNPTKQTQWAAFVRKSKLAGIPTNFSYVLVVIKEFLAPIAVSISSGNNFKQSWKAGTGWN